MILPKTRCVSLFGRAALEKPGNPSRRALPGFRQKNIAREFRLCVTRCQ